MLDMSHMTVSKPDDQVQQKQLKGQYTLALQIHKVFPRCNRLGLTFLSRQAH